MAFKTTKTSKSKKSNITAATIEQGTPAPSFLEHSKALAAPSTTLADLFAGPDIENDTATAARLAKLEKRNIPQLLKPDQIPMGGAIQGTIIKFLPSPDPKIKGCLIHLQFTPPGHTQPVDFCFPCTGSVRNALAPGSKDDDKDLQSKLALEVGKYFWAKRCPDKMNEKYKKNMFMFDVRTGMV